MGTYMHILTSAHMHRPTQELKHQKAARCKDKAMGGDSVFRKETQISVHVLVNNVTKCQIWRTSLKQRIVKSF